MESYILWGSKQFRQFFVLLMDDPDLYNYVIFSSNSYNTARAKARQMGYEKKVGYQRIAAKYNCTNITVLTFSDFIYKKEYQSTLSACRDYLAIDKAYQDDLISIMHKGIGGKIEEYFDQNRFSEKEKKFTINTLFQYILEEFAAIIYVSEQIAPIEVDPYEEFSTKTQLYAGAYPDLAARIGITQRGHLFVLPNGIVA